MISSGTHSIAFDECMALTYVGELAQEHHVGLIGNFHVTAALFEETEDPLTDMQRCLDEGKNIPGYVFGLGGLLNRPINVARFDAAITAFLAQRALPDNGIR
jgi:hypothetical protein